jgi:hypothetical protein
LRLSDCLNLFGINLFYAFLKNEMLALKCEEGSKCSGNIEDFFTLMGDADYLVSPEGAVDHYVMCWFDDTEPDMTKDLRRLKGVTLKGKVNCALNEGGKRTYNAAFKAEHSKLK